MLNARKEDGKIFHINDFESGARPYGDFECLNCEEKIIYVSQSYRNRSHFRHISGQECLNPNNIHNYRNTIENKMSEFHRNWQSVFPSKLIEYKIERSNIKHRADIHFSSENQFNILDLFAEPVKNCTIEIQNSPISKEKLMERESFYKDNNSELIWIFNLKQYKIEEVSIKHLAVKNTNYFKIRIFGNNSFPLLFKNSKSIILLDNATEYLYHVINLPHSEFEICEARRFQRSEFLKCISHIIGEDIKWQFPENNSYVSFINYTNLLLNTDFMRSEIKLDDKDEKLQYLFYILEKIPIRYLSDNLTLIFKIGAGLSQNDINVYNFLSDWVKRHKPNFSNSFISFGKYKGQHISQIEPPYMKWILDNNNKDYCRCNGAKTCNHCLIINDIKEYLKYKTPLYREYHNLTPEKQFNNLLILAQYYQTLFNENLIIPYSTDVKLIDRLKYVKDNCHTINIDTGNYEHECHLCGTKFSHFKQILSYHYNICQECYNTV